MTPRANRPRIWTVTFLTLILISLAATGIVDALQAGLPIFIETTGRAKTTSGLLVTVFAIAGIVPFLASGALADRFGSRGVLIVGAAFLLLGVLGPLFAPSVEALFGFRVLQGIGFAAVNVASAAGATNILPRERLGEGIGYYGLGQSIAIALGPALGLTLVNRSPAEPREMWLVTSGLAAFCLIAGALCFCDRPRAPEKGSDARPKKEKTSFHALFIEKHATLPSIMTLVYCAGACSVIVFVGLYSKSRGFGVASPFFIIAAAAMLATRFGSSLFMDRCAPKKILIPAFATSALSLVMLAFAPNRATLLLAGVPFGLGFGVAIPTLGSVAVKRSPRNRSGAANSMFYLCLNLGFGFGAFLGGQTIDLLGFRNAFLSWLVTIVVPVVLGLIYMNDPSTRELSRMRVNVPDEPAKRQNDGKEENR